MASKKLWGGRFTGKTDPLMEAFDQSINYDRIMYKADITGSIAYVKAIQKAGIVTPEESELMQSGLSQVLQEWESGSFQVKPGDEDIHTANERRLSELIGSAAGKLHTGRSRNDQIATDFRLWLRSQLDLLLQYLSSLVKTITERASVEIDIIIPGYTHLQRAQPVRWSHFLLNYAFLFQADYKRLQQIYERVNQSPLGCGALAGNPFGVDREFLAAELGFENVIQNSIHGVSDRDYVAEFLFWSSLVMIHISRLAEDLIIYSTAEFGLIKLADAYSTGSSIMPQKKNPDSLELLRGKSGRLFGNMSGFMMTYKGLPTSYNKDLQEDKEPVFDTVSNLSSSLQITNSVIATLHISPDAAKALLTDDMLATDLADYLVRKGVPFRETHHVSGRAVQLAEQRNCQLSQLTLADLQTLHPLFEKDVENVWNFENCVENRQSTGGTSKNCVNKQISILTNWFNSLE
ncbi:putative argininosuccinate lyase [Smittium mucronatum]|uniref:Argininosuccinate lyase n=1 Tax=Smittium mucronatum TaxID=133383 RepID=A0A1R0H535_9FUNG|nr:putative argininosuccinate lyase [Smittium mucronatum]